MRTHRWSNSGLIGACLVGLLLVTAIHVEAVCTFQWDPVTTNCDGSPLTSTMTYRIYRAAAHQGYTIGAPFTTTTATSIACSTVAPAPGPWYVTVTALKDSNTQESLFANELSPSAAPGGLGAK